jgi:hypothetical protein
VTLSAKLIIVAFDVDGLGNFGHYLVRNSVVFVRFGGGRNLEW